MRRLFWVALGATAGVLLVRRATRAAERLTPESMGRSLLDGLGGLGDAIRDFGEDLREAMAEREQELRTELGLDGRHDVVDADLLDAPTAPRHGQARGELG